MTELLYDCLYLLPLALTALSFAHGGLENSDVKSAWIIIGIVTSAYILLMKHLKLRGKAVLAGVLLTALLGLWIFLPSKDRMDIIKDHLWILWEVLIVFACFLITELASRYRWIRIVLAAAGCTTLVVLLIFSAGNGIQGAGGLSGTNVAGTTGLTAGTTFVSSAAVVVRNAIAGSIGSVRIGRLTLGKMLASVEVNRISVSMIFLFSLLTLVDEVQRRSKKEGDTNPKKHLVAVSPFLIAIFLISLFLKFAYSPYNWGFVDKVWAFVKSEYILLCENVFGQSGWDKDTPMIGFSDRAGIGGDLKKPERVVLEIGSLSANDRKIYLAGKSYDTFDGRGWQKTDDSLLDERLLDTVETVSAVMDGMNEAPLSDYVKRGTISIKYKDLHTTCLFLPTKILPSRNPSLEWSLEGGDYTLPEKSNSKKSYQVEFCRINKDSEAFKRLTELPHTVSEESFDEAAKTLGIRQKMNYSDYLEYHDRIYEYYLPETEISPKLEAYIDELFAKAEEKKIADGAESGELTDYEKLKLLESMFREFRYTEKPGNLPESIKNEAEYLDYFIFEKKEGYCSYYATAFVLLSRHYGIPARYMQGFGVTIDNKRKVEVNATLAHAWPEAYLEGIGWIGFEPTPGMRRDASWATQSEGSSVGGNHPEGDPYMPEIPGQNGDSPEGGNEIETGKKNGLKMHWYVVVIPVAAGVIFTMLLFFTDRLIKRKRYEKLSERGKVAWLCKNSMEQLKRIRAGRRNEETLSEYRERLRKEFKTVEAGENSVENLSENHIAFLGVYEEVLYAERPVSTEERAELEVRFEELKKFCRKRFWQQILTRKK